MKLVMPSRLKFKGNILKVSRGPEPDEIVWENLEVIFSIYLIILIFHYFLIFLLLDIKINKNFS